MQFDKKYQTSESTHQSQEEDDEDITVTVAPHDYSDEVMAKAAGEAMLYSPDAQTKMLKI